MNNDTMNELFDDQQPSDRLLSIHAHSPQPSPDDGGVLPASAPASAPHPRRRTLKERIKWNMSGRASSPPFDPGCARDGAASSPSLILEASPTPSAATSVTTAFMSNRSRSTEPTPTQFSTKPRRESVLAAASALTSLRVASPAAAASAAGVAAAPSFGEQASSRALAAGAFGAFGAQVDAAAASRAAISALDEILPLRSSNRFAEEARARGPPVPPASRSLLQTLLSLQPPQPLSCEVEGRLGQLNRLSNEVAEMKRRALGQPSSGENLLSMTRDAEGGPGSVRPFASLLGSDVPLTFPQKLMEVLSNPEISDIVTWLPHGRGFIILQKRRFAADVMPLYFKHSKFTSFTRKLNRWGFRRVGRGPEMGAYYHQLFQRGNYLLCMQMHCQSGTKAGDAKDVGVSPTPPQEIETLPMRTEAMSPLELDAASPPPAPESTNGEDVARVLPRTFGGGGAFAGPLSPISEGREASPSLAGPPSPSRVGGTLVRVGHRQERQQRQRQPGSFDRAFARQQEMLREANSTSASASRRTARDADRGRVGLGSNATPPSSSSSLQQLWSNVDQAAVRNPPGANAPVVPSSSGGAQDAVRAALVAQMRQLDGRSERGGAGTRARAGGIPEAAPGADPAPSGGADPHAAMLEEMRRLDRELRAQRAIIARGGGKAAGGPKPPGGDPMSQRDVARLYHRISAGRPERRAPGDAPRPSGEERTKRKYRAVRRASAA